MPSCGNSRPTELTGPFRSLLSKLSSFSGIGQQINSRINPQSLRGFVFDAEIEAVRIPGGFHFLERDFDAELNAFLEPAEIRSDRNAPASLRLPNRSGVKFREIGRMGEDGATLIKLSHFRLFQMPK